MPQQDRPGDPSSILLVRLGGLGDLLAVVPSIRLLRRRFPGSRLTLACREDYGPLLARTGLVDGLEAAGSARFSKLYREAASDPVALRDWLRGFGLAVGWFQGRGTGALDFEKALAARGLPVKILTLSLEGPLPVGRGSFEATLRAFGAPPDGPASFEDCLGLPMTEDMSAAGRKLAASAGFENASSLIIMHPGAGSRTKRWPVERFLSVAAALADGSHPGLIVTGPAETGLAAAFEAGRLPPRWKHVPQPDLIGLAGLLSACALYIGNDSGVTHLAAASGATVLALFRTEFEAVWRPEGRVTIVHAGEVDLISTEAVLSAARRALA